MKKKTIAVIVTAALVLLCTVGGTLAWLVDSTDEVKNTFTHGDIDIALAETTTDYKMVPGYTIAKDPTVTVEANSEACYLFVKVDKSTNFDTFMTYEMAEGWTALDDTTGVFYREVKSGTAEQSFAVLKDNRVTVNGEVTKVQLTELTEATNPTLTFTAYASQLYKTNNTKFTVTEAWAIVNPTA